MSTGASRVSSAGRGFAIVGGGTEFVRDSGARTLAGGGAMGTAAAIGATCT
jgi:hypothetical protein